MPWARITCVIKIKQIFHFHQTYRILNDRSIALAPSTAQLKPALWNDNLSTVDHWTICPLPCGFLSINTCTVSCLWLGIHRWRGPTVRHWPAAFYTGNLRIRQFWYPQRGGGGGGGGSFLELTQWTPRDKGAFRGSEVVHRLSPVQRSGSLVFLSIESVWSGFKCKVLLPGFV